MKDRRFRTTVLFLLGLLLILVLTILFFSSQGNENKNNHTDLENIEYGEVYTFPVRDDSLAYIKFLDETHYVAIPNRKKPEDCFADGEAYNLSFVQGEYKEEDGKFILGIRIERIALFFNDDIELKNREYDEMYVSEKPEEMSFEKEKNC